MSEECGDDDAGLEVRPEIELSNDGHQRGKFRQTPLTKHAKKNAAKYFPALRRAGH